MIKIPFNKPTQVGREEEAILSAYHSGSIAGDGPYGKRVEALLQQHLGTHRVLLTTSCTHALEMAGILLDLAPGDEVIVPSFTFVTTALAFLMTGGTPVFADIRPDTLNIDETRIEPLITPRTRAIVVVHYAGVGCEMDAILSIAERHGLRVIEDNAHGLFGRYKGRLLGTFGALATQSFHETKNFTCGEGGALVVNDRAFAERAEIIREKGTNRSKFFRGEVDKYSWVDRGSSYVLSDVQAAILYTQLGVYNEILAQRRQLWACYREALEDWADEQGIRLPIIPVHCDQAYHMFYLLMPDRGSRDGLIGHLGERGIKAVFHYLPLERSTMGRSLGGAGQSCPVSADVSERLVRLPFYTNMSAEEQALTIDATKMFSAG